LIVGVVGRQHPTVGREIEGLFCKWVGRVLCPHNTMNIGLKKGIKFMMYIGFIGVVGRQHPTVNEWKLII